MVEGVFLGPNAVGWRSPPSEELHNILAIPCVLCDVSALLFELRRPFFRRRPPRAASVGRGVRGNGRVSEGGPVALGRAGGLAGHTNHSIGRTRS